MAGSCSPQILPFDRWQAERVPFLAMARGNQGRIRTLIFDPFAGISGDMILGGLVDLGLSADRLRDLVDSLGIGARVHVERADRSGISCGRVWFEVPEARAHRHLPQVLEVIGRSSAPAEVMEQARRVFERLAGAEAEVHGVPVERVHFHEVGALDSILDVLCGVWGVHEMGYERFFTRGVAVGSGTLEMAHGSFPLPAPATAKLLEGLPVRETGFPEECTTPTGAAILAVLTGGARPPEEVVYGRSGFGAGGRNPRGRPNCLRLIEGWVGASEGPVYVVQADLDDMAPEYVAAARDDLVGAGARDVVLSRVDMKKGRPGIRIEALVDRPSLTGVLDALFIGTRTIGVRYWEVHRAVLDREEEVREWRGHRIRHKRVRLPDGRTRTKPEFDDVVAAARTLGMAPHELRAQLGAEVNDRGRTDEGEMDP
jgi:pyridinium-3,5-bisthiocarboxylic acid mononucleotide nickel chelatase